MFQEEQKKRDVDRLVEDLICWLHSNCSQSLSPGSCLLAKGGQGGAWGRAAVAVGGGGC